MLKLGYHLHQKSDHKVSNDLSHINHMSCLKWAVCYNIILYIVIHYVVYPNLSFKYHKPHLDKTEASLVHTPTSAGREATPSKWIGPEMTLPRSATESQQKSTVSSTNR